MIDEDGRHFEHVRQRKAVLEREAEEAIAAVLARRKQKRLMRPLHKLWNYVRAFLAMLVRAVDRLLATVISMWIVFIIVVTLYSAAQLILSRLLNYVST